MHRNSENKMGILEYLTVSLVSLCLPFEKVIAASLHGCASGIESSRVKQRHAVKGRHKQDS